MNGMFYDKEGNLSSKRVVGFVGAVVFLGLVVFSAIANRPSMSDLLWTVAVFSGSLLGIGVMERKK